MSQEAPSKPYVSYLLYLGTAFIAFFPSLLLGQAYFANDLLQFNYSARTFLKDSIAAGHFPLWNPYLLCGQPFFADPNSSMCYPLNYLTTLFFPVAYGFGVYFFLHMFIAACGMHLWLKSLRLGEGACRVGAFLFSLSGFFWWELIHPQNLAAFAWFPWFLAALEYLSRDLAPRRAFLAGLSLAVIGLAESFQMTSYFFYAGLFYFLYRVFAPRENPLPDLYSWKKWVVVILFGAWGGAILLIHIIPAAEFADLSNRTSQDQTYDNFNGQFSMRPSSTYEFLFPALGLPKEMGLEMGVQQITDQTHMDNAYLGIFGYMGVWIPFLAYLAFRRRDKRFMIFLLVLCLLIILFAWGRYFFLHQVLCTILPGIKLSRVPFRILACYIAFMGLLGAYGYQELEKAGQEAKKEKGLALAGGVFALVAFLIALVNPGGAWREMLALLVGTLGLFLWTTTESWRQLGRYCFLTALIAPLFMTGWSDFGRGPQSNYDLDKNFPVLKAVKTLVPEGRLFLNASGLFYPVEQDGKFMQSYLPENSVEILGIRSISGYNPLQLRGMMEVRSEVGKNIINYFRLTAVNGILMGQDAGEVKGFTHLKLGNYNFYQSATPSVTAPSHWQWVPDGGQRLGLMQNPSFDPLDQVVLTDVLSPELQAQLGTGKAQLSYSRVKDGPNAQTFQVKLDKNSLVTFSEVNFPGWKAFVDGKPVKLFTANHVFRCLLVPAGEHTVEFRFEPSWAMPLLAGAILWLMSALAFLFFSRPKAEIHT